MAAKEYALQSAFNGGEFSPKLFGQILLKKYREACATLENFIVYPHGPAHTRPGFQFVAEVKDSSAQCRLVPFIYSNVQAYMMEFGNEYVRFFTPDFLPVYSNPPTNTTLEEVATPYLTADLPYLQFAQSFDVKYITHKSYPVSKLERLSAASFDLVVPDFDDGPYRNQNADTTLHMHVSAVSGTGVSLTATIRSGTYYGTWGDTAASVQAGFTASYPSIGFQFTVGASAVYLSSAQLSIDTAPASTCNVVAYLYSDSAGSPDTLLETADSWDISASDGDYVWSFTGATGLSADTPYWIVFTADAPDNAIRVGSVVANSDYGSGRDTVVASITNSLSHDWKCQVGVNTTATPAIFDPDHVGALWRLKHSGGKSKKHFSAAGQSSTPILLRGKFQVDLTPKIPMSAVEFNWDGQIVLQSSTDQVFWEDVATFIYSTTQNFVESKSGIYYRLYCKDYNTGTNTGRITQAAQWGTIRITEYVSANQVVGDVLFPFGSTDPTPDWREGEWSPYRGYPTTVCFHDDRLYFARDTTIWGSWISDYENFNPDGDTDSAAVTFAPVQMNNAMVWMQSTRGLMVGSLGEEGQVTGTNEKPITPTAIKCQIQTTVGCAQYPSPLKIGQAALFIQEDRRRVREFVYDLATDGFKSPDLAIRSEHITVGGMFDACYQQFPYSIAWFVRGDGVLLGMTYHREEDVIAWHRTITDGAFESCATIPLSPGVTVGHDQLWTIVNRSVGGGDKRYIEVMADHEAATAEVRSVTEFLCLDSAVVFTAPTSLTLTGLSHLNGQAVTVVADGIPISDTYTVAGGSLTLDLEDIPAVVHVGLPYTCTLQTMPIEPSSKDGFTVARQKQAYHLMLRLLDSLGGKVGPDLDSLTDIPYRTVVDLTDQQVPLFTGPMLLTYSANSMDMPITLQQTDPLPLTLVSAGILVQVGE